MFRIGETFSPLFWWDLYIYIFLFISKTKEFCLSVIRRRIKQSNEIVFSYIVTLYGDLHFIASVGGYFLSVSLFVDIYDVLFLGRYVLKQL